ncbi:unnamed protein product [Pleuronectes platessa]|uniref:Uncharacterized protein n=1 Tax=Pleuronectes platessa TaxID=8262 RepID=A0A9N7UJP3_PLEPL|nr:unnamed protein product [Pleuronectes platessa]
MVVQTAASPLSQNLLTGNLCTQIFAPEAGRCMNHHRLPFDIRDIICLLHLLYTCFTPGCIQGTSSWITSKPHWAQYNQDFWSNQFVDPALHLVLSERRQFG